MPFRATFAGHHSNPSPPAYSAFLAGNYNAFPVDTCTGPGWYRELLNNAIPNSLPSKLLVRCLHRISGSTSMWQAQYQAFLPITDHPSTPSTDLDPSTIAIHRSRIEAISVWKHTITGLSKGANSPRSPKPLSHTVPNVERIHMYN